MFLTLGLVMLVAGLSEGRVVKVLTRRQAFFNHSTVPFQQQLQGGGFQPPPFTGFQPQQQGQFGQFPQQFGQYPQQFGQFPPQQQFGQFLPQGQQPLSQSQGNQQVGVAPQRDIPVQQPSENSSPIPIVKLDIQPNLGDGKYQYSYETGNGIQAEERGSQKAVGEPAEEGTVAEGSYSYTDAEGNRITLSYVADENGFQPKGDHLPTPPPVPAEILAALEANAAEEAAQNNGAVSPSYRVFFRGAYNRNRYY